MLAALSGEFVGKAAVEEPNPPSTYRMRVEGSGRIGFVRGHAGLRLTATDGGRTDVAYAGDVQVGGTIATVGQRLIDTAARMMIRRFFECVAKRIDASETHSSPLRS